MNGHCIEIQLSLVETDVIGAEQEHGLDDIGLHVDQHQFQMTTDAEIDAESAVDQSLAAVVGHPLFVQLATRRKNVLTSTTVDIGNV